MHQGVKGDLSSILKMATIIMNEVITGNCDCWCDEARHNIWSTFIVEAGHQGVNGDCSCRSVIRNKGLTVIVDARDANVQVLTLLLETLRIVEVIVGSFISNLLRHFCLRGVKFYSPHFHQQRNVFIEGWNVVVVYVRQRRCPKAVHILHILADRKAKSLLLQSPLLRPHNSLPVGLWCSI